MLVESGLDARARVRSAVRRAAQPRSRSHEHANAAKWSVENRAEADGGGAPEPPAAPETPPPSMTPRARAADIDLDDDNRARARASSGAGLISDGDDGLARDGAADAALMTRRRPRARRARVRDPARHYGDLSGTRARAARGGATRPLVAVLPALRSSSPRTARAGDELGRPPKFGMSTGPQIALRFAPSSVQWMRGSFFASRTMRRCSFTRTLQLAGTT